MSATSPATRDRILDATQRLIQAHGFSGFSYADVAEAIGIRKASIHHHFPTKGRLAHALMVRYRAQFAVALAAIDAGAHHASALGRLERYQRLFTDVLRDDHRLCMCGMLASDFAALPPVVRREVRAFFDDNEVWLTRVLADGVKRKELVLDGPAKPQARLLLSAFEGAMLVARSHGDVGHFTMVAKRAIANVARAPTSSRRAS